MGSRQDGQEEQYVLRIADASLANQIRRILREEETLQGKIALNFPGLCGFLASCGISFYNQPATRLCREWAAGCADRGGKAVQCQRAGPAHARGEL